MHAGSAEIPPDAVVVGIDGSPRGWCAFDWAHAEARRTGRPLVIAHAEAPPRGQDPAPGAGTALLAAATARLVELDSEVRAVAVHRVGAPAELLAELGARAALVVLGSSGRGHLAHILLDRSPHRIIGRTACPVVVVPERSADDPDGRIVVGVSVSERGLAAMRFACAEARLRGAAVIGVRSWADQDWSFEGIGAPYPRLATWEQVERPVLAAWLTRARSEFPDVAVGTELSPTPVYWALEKHAKSAALIVLGSRYAADSHLPPVGPIAGWALRHLRCPVAVVGEPADVVAAGVGSVGEPAGAPRVP